MKLTKSNAIYLLILSGPFAIIFDSNSDHFIVFIVAGIALIPLAKLIGDSTEYLG